MIRFRAYMRHVFAGRIGNAGCMALLCMVVLLAASCGYHRVETSADLPDWIQTIYVEPWENNSTETEMSAWITDALREEFLRDSGLVLTSRDDADVILTGKVESVYVSGVAYISYDRAVEERVTADLSVKLYDRKTGEEIWKLSNIHREENYYIAKELMITESLKNDALQKLSQNVAEIIHHRVTGVY